jgi:GAF domain-containing protein
VSKPPPLPEPRDPVEDALVDLFERVPQVFGKVQRDGLYFLLDLALEKIPSDAGSVWLADLSRRDLRFAAARGPKASELLSAEVAVPMGKGLVGYCAQEGVGLAVGDTSRDPRHLREVGQRVGYEARSVLTTPILLNGRTLGAIQLVNRKGATGYSQAELAMLHYVAHQAAVYLEGQEAGA